VHLQPVYRVTVFVPPGHLRAVQDGILAIDPLRAGDYQHGMWVSAPGEEQFRPVEGARPASGRVGELSRVPSVRLEFLLPRDPALLERVLREGIHPYHPWESPAVFVDEAFFPHLPQK